MVLRSVLDFAKATVGTVLRPGDVALDATVGNGHDTVFLARAVGAGGRVFGFDVQEAARVSTRRRLAAAGVLERVTLVQDSHARMPEHLPPQIRGHVRAVLFNLGYLPGGPDKTLVTRPEHTVPALETACDWLAPGGLLSIVLYTGHPGGPEEAAAVQAWAEALDQHEYHALSYRFVNQHNAPPRLLLVEKRTPGA